MLGLFPSCSTVAGLATAGPVQTQVLGVGVNTDQAFVAGVRGHALEAAVITIPNPQLVQFDAQTGGTITTPWRWAWYQGFGGPTSPMGATIVRDFGLMPGALPIDTVFVMAAGLEALDITQTQWLFWKATTTSMRAGPGGGPQGDFAAVGRWNQNSGVNPDPTVAFPAVWPSDDGSNFPFALRVFVTLQGQSAGGTPQACGGNCWP
jgi:hypothetical protein